MASASLQEFDSLSSMGKYLRSLTDPITALYIAFSKVKYSCKTPTRVERGITLEVSREDMVKLFNKQNGICAISGVKLTAACGDPDKVSIDRKDSSKSYTKSNVQLVTQQINVAKSDYTDKDFVRMCINVAINNGYTKID